MINWVNELEPVERFILLLLYSRDREPVKGETWLQKEMFLIGKNVDEIGRKYPNAGYLKGPYSEAVDKTASQFQMSGFLSRETGQGISLTSKGAELARELLEQTKEEERKMVHDVKEFLNDMSSDELLAYIYSCYPESTENSDIKEQVKEKCLPAAVNLVRKRKISVEKGAEIANMPLKSFVLELKKRNVPVFEGAEGLENDLIAASNDR